jgi:methionine sulfoxide reductase heme-binding subunit
VSASATSRTARLIGRHAAVAAAGAVLVALFWASRPQWDPEMRLWKAFGDAGFVLLAATLALGPLGRLSRHARRLLVWRRQTGTWFALLICVHAFLILNGWAQWELDRFLGYEFIPQLGRTARLEPGFGLANILGVVALLWTLILLATSSDRAARLLGGHGWKFLHTSAYIVFWVATVHAAYFLFIHYTASFHRAVPPPDWFRLPFVGLAATVLGLQGAAFVKTVIGARRARTTRAGSRRRDSGQPTAATGR